MGELIGMRSWTSLSFSQRELLLMKMKTEGILSKMDQLVWFCLVQALQFAALSNLEYAWAIQLPVNLLSVLVIFIIWQYSMFGSILSIGAVLQVAMRVSSVICTAGWLAIYFSQGAILLDIGRFLTGPSIYSRNSAQKSPWRACNIESALHYPWSIVYIHNRNNPILENISSNCNFALHYPGFGSMVYPESPRWLAKVGREEEFEIALQRLHGKNADVSDEKAEIQDYTVNLQSLPKANILDLFQKRCIRSVIIGVGLMVFQQFSGINGVQFYASETFEAAGFSGSIGTTAYALMRASGAYLMDKSGRRLLVMVSATGMFICSILVGFSFSLKGYNLLLDWVPILVVSGVLIYVAFFSIGMGAGPWVIMSEIFPIDVKRVGGSLVVLVNWSSAWIVSYTYNFLMNWNSSGTYYLYGVVCVLTILFVSKVVPETKGKTLEEIQESLNP